MAEEGDQVPRDLERLQFGKPPRTLRDLVFKKGKYYRTEDSKTRIGRAAARYHILPNSQRPSPDELLDINVQAGDAVDWAPAMRMFLTKLLNWLNQANNAEKHFRDSPEGKENAWAGTNTTLIDAAMALWERQHLRGVSGSADVKMSEPGGTMDDESAPPDPPIPTPRSVDGMAPPPRATPDASAAPPIDLPGRYPETHSLYEALNTRVARSPKRPFSVRMNAEAHQPPSQAPIDVLRTMMRSLILDHPRTFDRMRQEVGGDRRLTWEGVEEVVDGATADQLLRLGDGMLMSMKQQMHEMP